MPDGGMETAELDKAHLWHPFTPMGDWCARGHEPLVIARGEGAYLFDDRGRRYLDGNSSIWTNIHGHRHPAIDAAVRAQLDEVAHCSFLGTTNAPAAELAAALAALFPSNTLERVFLSDDGSTAVECALKMALQFFQLTGEPGRRGFVSFEGAYHGDTLGAAALGGIPLFHGRFDGLGVPVRRVASVAGLDGVEPGAVAAVVIEPLVQGAAGMRLWPAGTLRDLRAWCDRNGALLVLDEVMTGFGRTGRMFACEHEGVTPDLMALAKGLTGGYLPLAATLTTRRIYEAFLGGRERAFYYGHSYSGNPLGCAAALANLRVFEDEKTLAALPAKIEHLRRGLDALDAAHPGRIAEVRQCGMIAGVELAGGDGTLGARACTAARRHGLLTRPVLDTVVFMPPLCTTPEQIDEGLRALGAALDEVRL